MIRVPRTVESFSARSFNGLAALANLITCHG
jgi:hypothetical protein